MTYNYPKIELAHDDDIVVRVGKTEIHIISNSEKDVLNIFFRKPLQIKDDTPPENRDMGNMCYKIGRKKDL